MKNVFAMSSLLLLAVACGGSGSGSAEKPFISKDLQELRETGMGLDKRATLERYEDLVLEAQPGWTLEVKETGEDYSIGLKYDEETGETVYQPEKISVKKTVKITLLAVDHNLWATLEEVTSPNGEKTERKIVIRNKFLPFTKYLIQNENARSYLGDILVGFDMKGWKKTSVAEFRYDAFVKFKMESYSLCNMVQEVKINGVFLSKGKTKKLDEVTQKAVWNCDKSLRASELRNLDLTYIKVCRENLSEDEFMDKNDDCKDEIDMSYLVR